MSNDMHAALLRRAAHGIKNLQTVLRVNQQLLPLDVGSKDSLIRLLFRAMRDYGSKLETCSSSCLFKAAEPFSTVVVCCTELLGLGPGIAEWTAIEKVELACCAAEAGVLSGLAKVASRVGAVAQHQLQKLSKQQVQDIVHLAVVLQYLILDLAQRWPQNLLLAKAFGPVLGPWADLAAALPACGAAIKRYDTPLAESTVRLTAAAASCIGVNVSNCGVDSSGLSIAPHPEVRRLYLSDGLYKLLSTNFALVVHGKHIRASGQSTVPSPSCSRLASNDTCSSSSDNSRLTAPAASVLQVPPYHQQLMDALGLQDANINHIMRGYERNRNALVASILALQLIRDYRRHRQGGSGSGSKLFAIKPLPLLLGTSSSGSSSSHRSLPAVTTSSSSSDVTVSTTFTSSRPPSSSSDSKPCTELSMLLTLIEWIALEPEFDMRVTSGLLAGLCSGVLALGIKGEDNVHKLPAETAAALLQPVLQLLTPAVLHILRGSAAASGDDRRRMLLLYCELMAILMGQGRHEDLAAVISKNPVSAAVALEAALRAHIEFDILASEVVSVPAKAVNQPAAPGQAAARAAADVLFTYKVVLAVHQMCRKWALPQDSSKIDGSGRGVENAAQLEHLPSVLASLLTTSSKIATAAIGAKDVEPHGLASRQLVNLAEVLNQALLTAQLGCFLGSRMTQQQQQHGRQPEAVAGSSAGSSNSSINSSSHSPWVMLVARSLMLVSASMSQGWRKAGEAAFEVLGVCKSMAGDFFKFAVPLPDVVTSSLDALDWMRDQLESILLSYSTAAGCGVRAAAAPTDDATTSRGSAANAEVVEHLLMLQQNSCDAFCAFQHSLTALSNATGAAVGGRTSFTHQQVAAAIALSAASGKGGAALQQQWNDCWQCLTEFATAVCNGMPVSSCCNNLKCVSMDKLSEQHLVGGKGCVCAGCGVARYCSQQCQKQHWKQHKVTCKRLRAAAAARPC